MESSHSVADLTIWHHVLLIGLSLITVLFLGLFIQEMRRGRAPMIESNWGGIGGGGGGWRMSSSLAYLLGMLGTATLLAIVLFHVENWRKPANSAGTEKKATGPVATPTASGTTTPTPATPTPDSPAVTPIRPPP